MFRNISLAAFLLVTQAHDSIPACNSLGCKKGTAEDTGEAYLAQRGSIPACNSLGCKKGTAEDTGEAYLAQRDSVPACNSLGCKKGTAADNGDDKPPSFAEKPSVPACNSLGCKKGTLLTMVMISHHPSLNLSQLATHWAARREPPKTPERPTFFNSITNSWPFKP